MYNALVFAGQLGLGIIVLLSLAVFVLAITGRIPFGAMAGDFIPQTDAGFATWSANFESGIDTEYATFGLTSGQATAYTTLDTAYQAAYLAATNPATRTPVTIAAKDTARTAAVANARFLAAIINSFPGVTNAQRTALGLTPRVDTRTPIPAPATKPVVIVRAFNPLSHRLQLRDTETPTSRAKPAGAIAGEVWCKIGTTPPASIADCLFLGSYTRNFFDSVFDGADAGKTAYYLTRWVTRTGLVGPTSDVQSATIAAV